MSNRKKDQKRALEAINEMLNQLGGQTVIMTLHQKGKNSWTVNEVKYAIEHDCRLENGPNPIDYLKKDLKE
jgi:hypothetical protein